jgi:hypothetical protein
MPCTVHQVTYDLLRSLRLNNIFGNPGSSELSVNVQASTDKCMGMDLSVDPPNYG